MKQGTIQCNKTFHTREMDLMPEMPLACRSALQITCKGSCIKIEPRGQGQRNRPDVRFRHGPGTTGACCRNSCSDRSSSYNDPSQEHMGRIGTHAYHSGPGARRLTRRDGWRAFCSVKGLSVGVPEAVTNLRVSGFRRDGSKPSASGTFHIPGKRRRTPAPVTGRKHARHGNDYCGQHP